MSDENTANNEDAIQKDATPSEPDPRPEGKDDTDAGSKESEGQPEAEERPQSKEARYRIRAKQAEERSRSLRAGLTAARRTILAAASDRLDPRGARDLYEGLGDDEVDALFDAHTGALDRDGLDSFISRTLRERPYLGSQPLSYGPIVPGIGDQPHHSRDGHRWDSSFGR